MQEESPQKRGYFNTMAKTLTTMEIYKEGTNECKFSSDGSEELQNEQGSIEVVASFYAQEEDELEITDDSDEYSPYVQDSRLESLSSAN